MNLLWFIEYLHIALGCVVPVLESVWIHGDREGFEYARILPCIEKQLLAWGYDKPPNNAQFFCLTPYRIRNSLSYAMGSLRFDVIDGMQVLTRYTVKLMYPQNQYRWQRFDVIDGMQVLTRYTVKLMYPQNQYRWQDTGHGSPDRKLWLSFIFLALHPQNETTPLAWDACRPDMHVSYRRTADGQLLQD
jgi:hypothetical protein